MDCPFSSDKGEVADRPDEVAFEAGRVEAVRLLRNCRIPATPKLVGPWPDAQDEQTIRKQIQRDSLQDAVTMLGKVSDDELHRLYATSQVFSLMSRCESFGIPAAEAMAFGTPIVSTDCCAIAEVCQTAGQFGPPGDPARTADALETALTDKTAWSEWSRAAVRQAANLTWENCARPFRNIPGLVQPGNQLQSVTTACHDENSARHGLLRSQRLSRGKFAEPGSGAAGNQSLAVSRVSGARGEILEARVGRRVSLNIGHLSFGEAAGVSVSVFD